MGGRRRQARQKEKIIGNETNEETVAHTSLISTPGAAREHQPELSRQPSVEDEISFTSQLSSSNAPHQGHADMSTTPSASESQHQDKRILIEADENGYFRPDNKPVSKIVDIFQVMFDKAGPTWGSTPKHVREKWFKEFQKYYKWPEGQELLIRTAFHKRGGKRFYDTLCEVKANQECPKWMHSTAYERLEKYWASEKHQRYSDANKKNRLGKDGYGPRLHTAGSKPFFMVEQDMEKELKRQPTIQELVTRTHTHASTHKKAGKPVDKKSEAIMHDFSEKVCAAKTVAATDENMFPSDGTQNVPAPPSVDEMSIYLEVVGGLQKDKTVYGLGSLFGGTSTSTSTFASHKRKHDEEMVEKMKKMERENQELREDVKKLNEKYDNDLAYMKKQMEQVMKIQMIREQVDEE